jgi:hypothetical protein
LQVNHYITSAIGETLSIELATFSIKVLIVIPGSFKTEGIYGQEFYTSNPIPANDDLRPAAAKFFGPNVALMRQADPEKAMNTVVDVVRGEGKANGRPWPLYLVLGEDADRHIRLKCTKLLNHVDQWGDVIKNVQFDA